MPYIFQQEEEQEKQPGAAEQVGPTNQTVVPNADQQSEGGPKAGAPTQSGAFTNLQQYLNANKGSDFGQQFAGKVGGQVDEAGEAQKQSEQGFKSAVDSSTVKYNPDLVQKALKDPTNFVKDQAQLSQFSQQRDAEYKGPKTFSDSEFYTPAYEKTAAAKSAADNSKTTDGRQALLQQYYARPDYGKGMTRLDNLLIQNDEGARQSLAPIQQKGAQAASAFDSLKNSLTDYSTTAAGETAKARAQTRGALGLQDDGTVSGGPIATMQAEIDAKTAARQAQYDREVSGVRSALQSRDVSQLPSDWRKRLDIENVDTLYGIDPSEFLSPVNRDNINRASVATPQQQAQLAALSQLANKENTFLPDASLAGTMDDEALYGFDAGRLTSEIGRRKAAFDNDLSGAYASVPGTLLGSEPGDSAVDRDAILAEAAQLQGVSPSTNPEAYNRLVESLKGKVTGSVPLVQTLEKARPLYEQQLFKYSQMINSGDYDPAEAAFIHQNYIAPYQALMKQKSDIESKHKIHDSLRK